MIRRLLVANRGEIARRVFASCRLIGIDTVAVYSDADAGSPHVAEADYAVHLPGNASPATYLRGDLVIAAAHKSGADAIHPGYGFLAENADFAAAVADAGLTWVGPPSKAIALMGSKIEAKGLVAEVDVPTLPSWTDPDLVSEFPVLVKVTTVSPCVDFNPLPVMLTIEAIAPLRGLKSPMTGRFMNSKSAGLVAVPPSV